MKGASVRPAWVVGAVFGLAAMIVWTAVVKYLVPLLWSASAAWDGRPPGEASQVMWDFWPLTHFALALLLWRGARFAFEAALALALAEIAVVSAKFALFLRAPAWSFWKLLWFTNKVYVLLYFVVLVALLALYRRRDFDDARRPRWSETA